MHQFSKLLYDAPTHTSYSIKAKSLNQTYINIKNKCDSLNWSYVRSNEIVKSNSCEKYIN